MQICNVLVAVSRCGCLSSLLIWTNTSRVTIMCIETSKYEKHQKNWFQNIGKWLIFFPTFEMTLIGSTRYNFLLNQDFVLVLIRSISECTTQADWQPLRTSETTSGSFYWYLQYQIKSSQSHHPWENFRYDFFHKNKTLIRKKQRDLKSFIFLHILKSQTVESFRTSLH